MGGKRSYVVRESQIWLREVPDPGDFDHDDQEIKVYYTPNGFPIELRRGIPRNRTIRPPGLDFITEEMWLR